MRSAEKLVQFHQFIWRKCFVHPVITPSRKSLSPSNAAKISRFITSSVALIQVVRFGFHQWFIHSYNPNDVMMLCSRY